MDSECQLAAAPGGRPHVQGAACAGLCAGAPHAVCIECRLPAAAGLSAAAFESFAEGGRVAALDKQVRASNCCRGGVAACALHACRLLRAASLHTVVQSPLRAGLAAHCHTTLQIRGVTYCLEHLGPWCAAAAAYLDLLAPPAELEEDDDGNEQHESEGSDELDRACAGRRQP